MLRSRAKFSSLALERGSRMRDHLPVGRAFRLWMRRCHLSVCVASFSSVESFAGPLMVSPCRRRTPLDNGVTSRSIGRAVGQSDRMGASCQCARPIANRANIRVSNRGSMR